MRGCFDVKLWAGYEVVITVLWARMNGDERVLSWRRDWLEWLWYWIKWTDFCVMNCTCQFTSLCFLSCNFSVQEIYTTCFADFRWGNEHKHITFIFFQDRWSLKSLSQTCDQNVQFLQIEFFYPFYTHGCQKQKIKIIEYIQKNWSVAEDVNINLA